MDTSRRCSAKTRDQVVKLPEYQIDILHVYIYNITYITIEVFRELVINLRRFVTVIIQNDYGAVSPRCSFFMRLE